jgi:hypothetical protein
VIALVLAVVVGSKQFTESVILAEVATQTLQSAGIAAQHRRELGGTRVLWEALRARQIDAYPEYTGTITEELLPGERDLHAALARLGLRMTAPLGFEDNYAIGMRRDLAERLRVRSISDLSRHPITSSPFARCSAARSTRPISTRRMRRSAPATSPSWTTTAAPFPGTRRSFSFAPICRNGRSAVFLGWKGASAPTT